MTQDPPRMISVLSGTNGCVGFLRSAGPRSFQAYDDAGRSVALGAMGIVPATIAIAGDTPDDINGRLSKRRQA